MKMNVNWKSRKVWAAIASGGLLIAQGVGLISVPEQYEAVQYAANAGLTALVAVGVLTDAST